MPRSSPGPGSARCAPLARRNVDADVLIVGAGHGGLAVAHGLRRAGRDVLLLDAHDRVGDTWRTRWDSLRLFTPRDIDTLPGLPFPRGEDPFPSKDEVADYQERYASETRLPTRLGERVRSLRRTGELFEAAVGGDVISARSVVIAVGHHQVPDIPASPSDRSSSSAPRTPAGRSRSRWRASGRPRSRSARASRYPRGAFARPRGGSSRCCATASSTSARRTSAGSRGRCAPAAISTRISTVPPPSTGSGSRRVRWMPAGTKCDSPTAAPRRRAR
ncbi:MAG: FAD-binding protein [Chloroflexi bacterium]|nr:MAG: FAD-binding protein [Chloroflexota bacterium]